MDIDVVNIPCYLIFLFSSLLNTPRYPSLLNSLHSFDALSARDDLKALLLLFLSYVSNVPVKSKFQHPPPPGQPPGN